MFCKKCHGHIPDTETVCQRCGTPIPTSIPAVKRSRYIRDYGSKKAKALNAVSVFAIILCIAAVAGSFFHALYMPLADLPLMKNILKQNDLSSVDDLLSDLSIDLEDAESILLYLGGGYTDEEKAAAEEFRNAALKLAEEPSILTLHRFDVATKKCADVFGTDKPDYLIYDMAGVLATVIFALAAASVFFLLICIFKKTTGLVLTSFVFNIVLTVLFGGTYVIITSVAVHALPIIFIAIIDKEYRYYRNNIALR